MSLSSGARGKCDESNGYNLKGCVHLLLATTSHHLGTALSFQSQIPCAGSFGCQRIHVILKATTTSLTERGTTYGKIDFAERGCQITGDQHCHFGCSSKQWANFLCSVCAKWLRVLYRCWPSGVYRKMHPSCKASGKKRYIPQAAKCPSLSCSVSLLEPNMSDKTKVQRWTLFLGGDGIGKKKKGNSSIWYGRA